MANSSGKSRAVHWGQPRSPSPEDDREPSTAALDGQKGWSSPGSPYPFSPNPSYHRSGGSSPASYSYSPRGSSDDYTAGNRSPIYMTLNGEIVGDAGGRFGPPASKITPPCPPRHPPPAVPPPPPPPIGCPPDRIPLLGFSPASSPVPALPPRKASLLGRYPSEESLLPPPVDPVAKYRTQPWTRTACSSSDAPTRRFPVSGDRSADSPENIPSVSPQPYTEKHTTRQQTSSPSDRDDMDLHPEQRGYTNYGTGTRGSYFPRGRANYFPRGRGAYIPDYGRGGYIPGRGRGGYIPGRGRGRYFRRPYPSSQPPGQTYSHSGNKPADRDRSRSADSAKTDSSKYDRRRNSSDSPDRSRGKTSYSRTLGSSRPVKGDKSSRRSTSSEDHRKKSTTYVRSSHRYRSSSRSLSRNRYSRRHRSSSRDDERRRSHRRSSRHRRSSSGSSSRGSTPRRRRSSRELSRKDRREPFSSSSHSKNSDSKRSRRHDSTSSSDSRSRRDKVYDIRISRAVKPKEKHPAEVNKSAKMAGVGKELAKKGTKGGDNFGARKSASKARVRQPTNPVPSGVASFVEDIFRAQAQKLIQSDSTIEEEERGDIMREVGDFGRLLRKLVLRGEFLEEIGAGFNLLVAPEDDVQLVIKPGKVSTSAELRTKEAG